MLSYYGYTISPNQIETGEGFLICRNVPIARTGEQEYAGSELGLNTDNIVKVFRPPEEVFDPAALASFEGKPVTNDHPPTLVTPDDVSMYEMGHAQNVRKGVGEWDGYVLADLHIHDRSLIDAIQSGKREISCGYGCEWEDNGDGTYTQKRIRGNHIAVVDRGRAGKRAAILDSERKVNMFKKGFLEYFGKSVKDKTPEEISRMAADAEAALEKDETTEPVKEPTSGDNYKEKLFESIDDDVLDGLVEKIMARLAAKKAEKEEGDPMQDMIKKLSGEEAHTVPAEEMDEKDCMDDALKAAILRQMQPSVAGIKDASQRKAVADALIKCVTAKDGANSIGNLLKASQAAAKNRANDSKKVDYDAIQKLYDNMNPHKKEAKLC